MRRVRYHNVIADCEGWHPTRHASEGLGLADHRREAAGLSGLRSRGGRFVFRQLRSIFSGVSLRARARSAATFIAIEAIRSASHHASSSEKSCCTIRCSGRVPHCRSGELCIPERRSPARWAPVCGELLILGKLVIRHTQAVALKKTPDALKHEGRSMTMMTCSAGHMPVRIGTTEQSN